MGKIQTLSTLNFLEGIKWVFLEGNGRESHDIHHDVKLLKVNLIYEKKAFQSQFFFTVKKFQVIEKFHQPKQP